MLKIIKPVTVKFTHRLEFDVLTKDLKDRKIEINFNGWDEWGESGCSPMETALVIYRMVMRGLEKDKLTLGWKAALFHVEQNRKITEYPPFAKTRLQ